MHLRRAADQGHRQPGQGRRLVRQRVGLLQPPRRPDQVRRRDPLSRGRSDSYDELGEVAGQAGPGPLGPQRARSTARTHHRRRPDPGQRPDHQGAGRRRRPGGRDRPPGPAEGRARGPTYSLRAGRRAPRRAARPGRRLRHRHGRRVRPRDRRPALDGRRGRRCWRTSGSTPARPARTTPSAARSPTSWPALADAFVSDGFGVVHRKQASVYDVAQRLPHAMGGLVAAEVEVLQRLTEDPERPYVVVLGGSKVSDKLGVIDNLLGKADKLLIGGGMVFTFLKAQGHEVGKSLLEEDQVETCRDYLQRARGHRRRDRAADRHRGRHRVPVGRPRPAATGRRRPTRSRPTRSASTSARTPAAAFAEAHRRRADGLLERPDGRLRDSRPSPRAPGRSPRR